MTGGEWRRWEEVAASNRERINTLERETERMRSQLHEIRSEVQTIRFLAEKIGELATDVKTLAGRVEAVSRHAVNRPSPSSLAVLGQYFGVVVAIIALVIAARS